MNMSSEFLHYARVLEQIGVNTLIARLTGEIVYINLQLLQTLGYAPGEVASLPFNELVVDPEKEDAFQYVKKSLANNAQSFREELQLLCRNKSAIYCVASGFCTPGNSDTDQIVLLLRDKSSENAISHELEKKSLEMVKMNTELIRSNQELKRVSELKTKFLSIASHELKTPLTSIKGYAEIIIDNMKEKVDKGVFRMIESISRAADRLHNVINNILDVSRIEQKKLRLKPEDMSLQECIQECADELSQFLTHRNIRFKCEYAQTLPLFHGDKMRMHQVFNNLFSNALKYSPDNSEVEVRVDIEKQDFFHIIVIDHGIGIDKGELQKVFDPFYEVGSTIRHSTDSVKFMGGGTGLGLSIVKGVVERHGGVIWAESEGALPDRYLGSQFHILLPIRSRIQWDDDETQIIKLNKIIESPTQPLLDLAVPDIRRSLLIIDDDVEAIEITKLIFESTFDIITAKTGEDGLRIAFQKKPAIILLDLYLPGLDGFKVCRILRSMEETKNIPISFFTAATQQEEIEKCFTSGADDCIVKPFTSKELVEKVNRLLSLKKKPHPFT